jgi:ribonuclease-3
LTAPSSSTPAASDTLPGLGHRFADPALLRRALSHRSVGQPNYERLEFLGDGLVGAVAAQWLYQRFPRSSEGELTRMRARLVRQEALAAQARSLQLGEHLRLGPGELKSGGFRRDSILADAFEALVAAIFLDAGWDACRDWLQPRLAQAAADLVGGELADAKTRLQEWLQSRGRPLPEYVLVASEGEAHAQVFHVECRVEGEDEPGRGSATSRKPAEQAAATLMLHRLESCKS